MDLTTLTELLHSCGAPLAMFIIGLFFPQVRLAQIFDALKLTHSHDQDGKKG